MRLDVLLGESLPRPADVAGRMVVVLDVLRASTVIVDALANDARAVVPFAEVDDVVQAAKRSGRDEARLTGERRRLPTPGSVGVRRACWGDGVAECPGVSIGGDVRSRARGGDLLRPTGDR